LCAVDTKQNSAFIISFDRIAGPWGWRHCDFSKHRKLFNPRHDGIFLKTWIFSNSALRKPAITQTAKLHGFSAYRNKNTTLSKRHCKGDDRYYASL